MPDMTPEAIWSLVHEERRALADDLASLPDVDWQAPSLGTDWSVHGVLAHLIHDAKTTRWSFVRDFVAAGFNFDRSNERWVEKLSRQDPALTLEKLRLVAGLTGSAPAPLPSRLVEVIVHGEDIRRPLGIAHEYPLGAVVTAVRYQLATGVNLGGGKERAADFRLLASDADVAVGNGPEVRGSALALLLALTGRPVRKNELTGTGAAEFAS